MRTDVFYFGILYKNSVYALTEPLVEIFKMYHCSFLYLKSLFTKIAILSWELLNSKIYLILREKKTLKKISTPVPDRQTLIVNGLVRKDIDVSEDERLSKITLRHKSK